MWICRLVTVCRPVDIRGNTCDLEGGTLEYTNPPRSPNPIRGQNKYLPHYCNCNTLLGWGQIKVFDWARPLDRYRYTRPDTTTSFRVRHSTTAVHRLPSSSRRCICRGAAAARAFGNTSPRSTHIAAFEDQQEPLSACRACFWNCLQPIGAGLQLGRRACKIPSHYE